MKWTKKRPGWWPSSEDSKRLENPPCHRLAMLALGLNCILLAAFFGFASVCEWDAEAIPSWLAVSQECIHTSNTYVFLQTSLQVLTRCLTARVSQGLLWASCQKYLWCCLLLWVKFEFVWFKLSLLCCSSCFQQVALKLNKTKKPTPKPPLF